MRILIVDDHAASLKLLRLTLHSMGHALVEAVDGMQALELLKSQEFELVISDILMPNLDGYRLCFEVRQIPRLKNLPIILYSSTYMSPSDHDLAMGFGASAFLGKPATSEKLAETIQEVLSRPGPRTPIEPAQDMGILKQYSERLITKIEEKNLELVRRTEELEASEEKFRQLAENIREVFWITNADQSVMIYVSPAYESIWGRRCQDLYENPREWTDAIRPEYKARIDALLANRPSRLAPFSWEYQIARPDGSIRWIHDRGFPIKDRTGAVYRFAGIAQDITERKSLENQLTRSQRMEAVGRLAGGVAHDFNNLLTAINGYSQLALARLDARDPLYNDVQEISKAGERAAALTRQLLAFSRRQVLQPRILNLNAVVADIERLLKRLIGENIELVSSLHQDLGSVEVDPGQIEQVIVNLAVNARDAMPHGGRLVLETKDTWLDETYVREHPGVAAGPYVLLAITDAGTGMSPDVKAHLFEPFYTTKEHGKGTGLGLATVDGIIRQSGGHVAVDSEMGRGTTFRVYLPRKDGTPEVLQKPGRRDDLRGSETVLLVEDEPAVRALARIVLTEAGYKTLDARQGEEALLIVERYEKPIHLLLSDLVMPGMNGLELSRRLELMVPGLRAIFMSGYNDTTSLHEGIIGPDMPFLSKPFTPDVLLSKVREVLDSKNAARASQGT